MREKVYRVVLGEGRALQVVKLKIVPPDIVRMDSVELVSVRDAPTVPVGLIKMQFFIFFYLG